MPFFAREKVIPTNCGFSMERRSNLGRIGMLVPHKGYMDQILLGYQLSFEGTSRGRPCRSCIFKTPPGVQDYTRHYFGFDLIDG